METIINIWNTYKGDIVPALVGALVVIISAYGYYISSKIRVQGMKDEAQAKILTNLSEKEDTRPELEAINASVQALKEIMVVVKDGMIGMTDLFNEAFQSSSLSPEQKERLNNIVSRIKNGVGEDVIKSLQDEIEKYKDLYIAMKEQIESAKTQVVEIAEKKATRVRN